MYILGINAYHADASAAIVCDGRLVAAVEEERFNRIKHCAGFPYQAVKYCLDVAGIKPEELTHIAIARDTKANLDKKLLYALKIPQMALRRPRRRASSPRSKKRSQRPWMSLRRSWRRKSLGSNTTRRTWPVRSSSPVSTRRLCCL